MQHPAWFLITTGLVLLGLGLLWLVLPAWLPLGRLPGDLHFERGPVRFHFPIVTCLLISVLLTAMLWLLRWLSR